MEFDHDFIIVGSGFGGSVSGLRLTEKGYDVLMLEMGSELKAKDFPQTNWNLKRWLWIPRVGFRGLFQLRFFRHVTVMAGTGVGGGSLVYANTLPVPDRPFFQNPSWASLASWEDELGPHYATAKRMLGVAQVPFLTTPDRVLKRVAEKRGQVERFEPTNVAVFFGEPGVTVPDPYFGGEGPERTGCNLCGGCMTGCKHGAKNTLDKNYLYFARKKGMKLLADTKVERIEPLPEGGYRITARTGRSPFRFMHERRTFTAKQIVLSAGALGTVDLLLKLREDAGALPKLSDQLGRRIRTNSEALIGVLSHSEGDLSKGIAIGSIYKTDDVSHIEPCRYGRGSGAFRPLQAPHVPGNAPGAVKLFMSFVYMLRHPIKTLRAYFKGDWASTTIILLYMRTMEGTLRFRRKMGLFGKSMGTVLAEGKAPTASIPEASELAQEVADEVDGFVGSIWTENIANIPTTAHLLGGCCMGRSEEDGVIDHAHRVFNYEGLYVIDGSAISANPGVNPSLTITALAERAMSFVPAKATASDAAAAQ